MYLAQWIVDYGIPVERDWLEETTKSIRTPVDTPSITVTRASIKDRTYLRLGIYGGVDFSKRGTYEYDENISAVVLDAEKARPAEGSTWLFQFDGDQYQAIAIRYEKPTPIVKTQNTWVRTDVTGIRPFEPYLLKLPTIDEVTREYSQKVVSCKNVSTNATNLVLRGKTVVWDKTQSKTDDALDLIPAELRAGSDSGRLTLFIIDTRGADIMGYYSVSKQPAYREWLNVSVLQWPNGDCLGRVRLSGGDPQRPDPLRIHPDTVLQLRLLNG